MNYQKYYLAISPDVLVFEFTSHGKHGAIEKVIRFAPTENEFIFNLGFGNKIGRTGGFTIDDNSINNNGDRNKILATIANAIFVFTEKYPGSMSTLQGLRYPGTDFTEWRYPIILLNFLRNFLYLV